MDRTLTCVYCGDAYPEGTPPSGSSVLTDHIKRCEKHPMKKLKDALVGLVGAEKKSELEAMEFVIRAAPIPDLDKVATINAIHALIEVATE
jgi:hypothetical protein